MSSIRISGTSEKFGPVSTSEEFINWEVPDIESETRMRRLLKEMGRSTLVLDAAKYGGLGLGERAHASFIDNEDFAAGREDSAHQVRFGQLVINGSDFREQPEFVAVKSYDNRADLYREWAAHEYLNSLFDRQLGYINLGVHNNEDGMESIVSEYDHGVTSFDSSFWAGENAPASALRPTVLRRHAVLGAASLGLMHGVRMTHGDAQVKNVASDRFGPRAIDLESAEILSEETIDSPEALLQTRRDLTSFIESMGRVEENRERVIEALSGQGIVDEVVASYQKGVRRGHRALKGQYVPNFDQQNEEVIREELDRLIR